MDNRIEGSDSFVRIVSKAARRSHIVHTMLVLSVAIYLVIVYLIAGSISSESSISAIVIHLVAGLSIIASPIGARIISAKFRSPSALRVRVAETLDELSERQRSSGSGSNFLVDLSKCAKDESLSDAEKNGIKVIHRSLMAQIVSSMICELPAVVGLMICVMSKDHFPVGVGCIVCGLVWMILFARPTLKSDLETARSLTD